MLFLGCWVELSQQTIICLSWFDSVHWGCGKAKHASRDQCWGLSLSFGQSFPFFEEASSWLSLWGDMPVLPLSQQELAKLSALPPSLCPMQAGVRPSDLFLQEHPPRAALPGAPAVPAVTLSSFSLLFEMQLTDLSGQLCALEEQSGSWHKKELFLYSMLASAWLFNIWLWLRR
uniref:Mff-like domain-containing protein n=1 Tax=Laticauda laticaudata TaxID=8630 RepID=A0A8C5RYX6_LATLA